MIKGFNHVGISVANLDRSIEFYRDVLGMELVAPPFPFGGPLFAQVMALESPCGRIGFLSNGSLQLELFEFSQPRSLPQDPNYSVADRGISHFCVEVTDIAAMYDRLLAAGVRFHCPVLRFPGGIQATYGRDPDGNVFELLDKSLVAS
jgi:catechol 2,3-dioxygenase-like lactoylglutathione lyase family enzyme